MRHRLPFLLAGLTALACAPAPVPTADLEVNKDLVRRTTEAVNAQDWSALDTLMTDDFTRHSAASPDAEVHSREEFVALQKAFLESMPNQRVTPERMVAEGDYVATYARYTGTQTGPMAEFPITGKAVDIPFFGMFRIQDGRIAELWVEWDNVAMLKQLGLFPGGGEG